MQSETILVAEAEGLTTITLNRPDKLNSFTAEMILALHLALSEAREQDHCRALLLTGAGRAFSAGQDLSDPMVSAERDLGETVEEYYNPLIRLLRSIEKPIVCAVNGVAAGAGANIALACDIVLAARSAKFIQAFSKIGLVPDSGGTWTLTRHLGEARAKALTMTAAPLSAQQAADWGLIWRAVADEELMAEAQTLAGALAQGPTYGLGLTKQAIQAASEHGISSQLELERDLQSHAGRSPDYAEGVAAFKEKRAPRFTGKA